MRAVVRSSAILPVRELAFTVLDSRQQRTTHTANAEAAWHYRAGAPAPSGLLAMFDLTALTLRHGLAGAALAVCLAGVTSALYAQTDFGDNSSHWANDGECDDPRFEGKGAANTLLDEDLGHDAADCGKLFDAGRITLRTNGASVSGDEEREDSEDGRVHDGRLEKGDDTLSSGEYADGYSFDGAAGQHAAVDLRSSDFDTYVFVRAPSGEQFDNDDFDDDASRSLLELDLKESGEYRVTVTSYEKGETGSYTLSIDVESTR